MLQRFFPLKPSGYPAQLRLFHPRLLRQQLLQQVKAGFFPRRVDLRPVAGIQDHRLPCPLQDFLFFLFGKNKTFSHILRCGFEADANTFHLSSVIPHKQHMNQGQAT